MLLHQAPMFTCTTPLSRNPNRLTATISMAADRAAVPSPPQRKRTVSALEARISLVAALAAQASTVSQRLLLDLATETAKYVFPKQFEARTLEEALMSVPDLETVKFKVLSRRDQYEIREVEPYFIAEVTMPGKSGFDFNGASQSFNVLAEYLFGKNTTKEKMEMTTPVFTRKAQSDGEKMEMTTPVITKRVENEDKWQMSFVMPSKYGANLPLPKDPSVKVKEVPKKLVAVVAFSGFVTDEEIKRRESKLREALKDDRQFQVKQGTSVEVAQYNPHSPKKLVAVVAFSGFVTDEEIKQRESKLREALKDDRQFQVKQGTSVEVAQYNPPFTLPFQRRNEISLEVESKEE